MRIVFAIMAASVIISATGLYSTNQQLKKLEELHIQQEENYHQSQQLYQEIQKLKQGVQKMQNEKGKERWKEKEEEEGGREKKGSGLVIKDRQSG